MSTKDKLEFVYVMAKHSKASIWHCQRLMRYAVSYQKLQLDYANGDVDLSAESEDNAAKRKEKSLEKSISKICAEIDAKPVFGGDPRGCTLKLTVPDGYTNDFGNEGICVPR